MQYKRMLRFSKVLRDHYLMANYWHLLLGTNVAIITFANSVSSNHAFSDEQDITALKQSLNHISSVVPFDANTILAFNEAQRLLNRERKQRMRRVIMFVSSGLYQCK